MVRKPKAVWLAERKAAREASARQKRQENALKERLSVLSERNAGKSAIPPGIYAIPAGTRCFRRKDTCATWEHHWVWDKLEFDNEMFSLESTKGTAWWLIRFDGFEIKIIPDKSTRKIILR
jgi:hypothetical protein